MSETASGFVRIATLVLVTAIFAIVWQGDQHAQQQFIIARKAAAERTQMLAKGRSAHCEAAERMHERFVRPETAPEPSTKPAQVSRLVRVEVEMELPAGIAPGVYQVVDQSGQMQKVQISAAPPAAEPRDLYVLNQSDGRRRYFIRISQALETPPEQTASRQSASRR